jgi:hypothetical protein
MDPPLPPGWQRFSNPNGQVIYANVSTGQFQETRPVAAAALALPPGWTQMTNDSGRTVYINQSLGRIQDVFPRAEAEQAQAPSAPPVDPRTEQVKTQYYPHIPPFSSIPPADIIEMLYHPYPPPDLTPDDIDLIINNYVGTAINGRRTICGEDADILSCAKKLFNTNAFTAKRKYSFKLPINQIYYVCDVPFRWNPDNESNKKLDIDPTAFLSSRLFPLNDNTVRWLCSTHTNPIPTMNEARESKFVLDFFDGPEFHRYLTHGKTLIEMAIANRDLMSTPAFIEKQARDAAQEREQLRKLAEQDRIRTEQRISLDIKRREQQALNDKEREDDVVTQMSRWRGGLKGKRKQTKRKQTKRKQTKRRT